MSLVSRCWKVLRRALVVSMALLALLLVLLLVLLTTRSGRNFALQHALGFVDDTLPGRVAVRDFAELSLDALELRGIEVFDPTGKRVLTLERLRAELDLLAQRPSHIVVDRVLLEKGSVDLSEVAEPQRGLAAAFVDPDVPPSPPSKQPPPYLLVRACLVSELALTLPRPTALAPSHVRRLELQASFELDQTPRASVEHLRLDVERDGERLARLERLRALLGRGKETSSLSLAIDALGIGLELEARGVVPPEPGWKSAPVSARLAVSGLSAQRLSRMARDPGLARAFLGEVGLDFEVTGSLNQLTAKLGAASAGGPLELRLTLGELRRLGFDLGFAGFEPARVVPDAPTYQVRARLHGGADFGPGGLAALAQGAPRRIAVNVELEDATLDGEALPHLEAKGLVLPAALEQLELGLSDQVSEVNATGRVGFDSNAELDVAIALEPATLRRLAKLAGQRQKLDGKLDAKLRVKHAPGGELSLGGSVRARQLASGELRLKRLDAALDVSGRLPDLAGSVKLDLAGFRAGAVAVQSAVLDVGGGPKRYRARLHARSNQGDLDLSTSLVRQDPALLVEATGNATRKGQKLELQIEPTRIVPGGAIDTEGVLLVIAGQKLRIEGKLEGGSAELVLDARKLDLAALAKLLPEPPALRGTLSLRASARGTPERPKLDFRVEGSDLALGERPGVDFDAEGTLDAPSGSTALELRVTDTLPPPRRTHHLKLALSAHSRFSNQEPLAQALQTAIHQLRLELAALDLELLQAMFPETNLPLRGKLEAALDVQGSLLAPRIALNWQGDLKAAWAKQPLGVRHQLHIDDAGLQTNLTLSDAKGDWVELSAATTLPPLGELMERPEQLLQEGRWHVDLALRERKLRDLPLPRASELPPARVHGSLSAAHAPGAEPEIALELVLNQAQAFEATPGCKAKDLRLSSSVSVHQGRLTAELLGAQAQRRLVRVDATAPLKLHAALGGGKPELGPLVARAHSHRLDLGSLPFVCSRYAGLLDLDARVRDPLGSRPDIELDLDVYQLSAGSRTSVDASLDVLVKPDRAELAARLRHGVNVSTASAKLPIQAGNGQLRVGDEAPLRGHVLLKHLPIDPFLDPGGSISYASGTLSGRVDLSGTLKSPHVKGAIELEDIGFTATDVAQPLRNIGGRIEFTEKRVRIRRFEAHDKDGVLNLDGELDFANLRRIEADFKLNARDFPLRQQGQVVATTAIDARIESRVTPDKTSVRVNLHHVDTWLESAQVRKGMKLEGHGDLVVDGTLLVKPEPTAKSAPAGKGQPKGVAAARKATANKAGAKQPGPVTEIVLDARDKFWVKRNDFAVKLAALLTARIEGEQVNVEGKVDLDRGYLQLMGKVFEIQRGGYLEFIGSPEPDPVLEIEALHENRRSGKIVKVRITGRGSAPVLDFSVDDVAVTAGDAFVALFGSQQSNQDPDAAGDQARQFVGGLTAGILATAARRELGAAAPIIMVEPGGGDEASRVRAGFELDSIVPKVLSGVITGVYFEGIVANEQNAEAQDANVHGGALLEIYFPKDFFSAGQYGPGTTWSVDVGWQL